MDRDASKPTVGQDGLLRFLCPNGHRLKASPKLAGKRVACPNKSCGELVVVPSVPGTPTPTAIAQTQAPAVPQSAVQMLAGKSQDAAPVSSVLPGPSGGSKRRLVLALTGGAAVLSIVLIGTSLFLFSRSSADQASVVSDGTTATSTKPRQDLARQLQDSRRRTDSDQAGRDKKLAAALDLFGDAASDASVEINAGRTVTTRSIAALRDAMEVTRAALKRRKLVEGWPLAAKNVAAKRKDAFIKLETTEKPTLEMVQSILGKEDSTEEDRKASVTWYKYGWCHFGVADKTVTFFRADGQYLNSGTWRVVTILRADCSAVKK